MCVIQPPKRFETSNAIAFNFRRFLSLSYNLSYNRSGLTSLSWGTLIIDFCSPLDIYHWRLPYLQFLPYSRFLTLPFHCSTFSWPSVPLQSISIYLIPFSSFHIPSIYNVFCSYFQPFFDQTCRDLWRGRPPVSACPCHIIWAKMSSSILLTCVSTASNRFFLYSPCQNWQTLFCQRWKMPLERAVGVHARRGLQIWRWNDDRSLFASYQSSMCPTWPCSG